MKRKRTTITDTHRERTGDRIARASGNAAELERIAYKLADTVAQLRRERDNAYPAGRGVERERLEPIIDSHALEIMRLKAKLASAERAVEAAKTARNWYKWKADEAKQLRQEIRELEESRIGGAHQR